jgi:hypothetical protein
MAAFGYGRTASAMRGIATSMSNGTLRVDSWSFMSGFR